MVLQSVPVEVFDKLGDAGRSIVGISCEPQLPFFGSFLS